ncbi:MAG TPA: chemotaxis protein CheW [Eubacteriaceae bacterium]|nr:chemotaxis protein CheW [Eubacteriaceae bacterium]
MQIIVFTLGDKYYALNSEKVDEISKLIDATTVPNSPDWVEGLINLRGNVVSLMNLSKLLQQNDDECYNNIIIINNGDEKLGILVNEVEEVLKVDEKNIEKVSADTHGRISGIIQLEEQIVNFIDIEKILQ